VANPGSVIVANEVWELPQNSQLEANLLNIMEIDYNSLHNTEFGIPKPFAIENIPLNEPSLLPPHPPP
jgi:hypothetical protein